MFRPLEHLTGYLLETRAATSERQGAFPLINYREKQTMKRILNLTQHEATTDQRRAGVIDTLSAELKKLLTFDELPEPEDVQARAERLAQFAADWFEEDDIRRAAEGGPQCYVMIGGAPFLMAPLEKALIEADMWPVYAFSRRETVEQPQPDGSVKKVTVFKHMGFVGPVID